MPVGLPEGSVHAHCVVEETARPTRGERAIKQLKTETFALLEMTGFLAIRTVRINKGHLYCNVQRATHLGYYLLYRIYETW
jgi:hypothetical protein